jgi:hypothetical protein
MFAACGQALSFNRMVFFDSFLGDFLTNRLVHVIAKQAVVILRDEGFYIRLRNVTIVG